MTTPYHLQDPCGWKECGGIIPPEKASNPRVKYCSTECKKAAASHRRKVAESQTKFSFMNKANKRKTTNVEVN